MRTKEQKKEEERKDAYQRGLQDALHGMTYKQGSSTVKNAELLLAYTRGFNDGLRAKAGFL